jgi:hypothetical protein
VQTRSSTLAAPVALGLLLAIAVGAGTASAKPEGVLPALGGAAKARMNKIRAFVASWLGTPYLWGGETRDGIDCSGFQRELYRTLFQVELPRTTHDQILLGVDVPIRPEALGKNFQPGDLFFYVDSMGTPNHVVSYMGDGKFTHSCGGRGVVIDGFEAIWGRRIVGRRVLVPAKGGDGGFGPIPAAGPIVPVRIPCPPGVAVNPEHIRRFMREPLDPKELEITEICPWRALGDELKRRGGPAVAENLLRIDEAVSYLESIEFLDGALAPRR